MGAIKEYLKIFYRKNSFLTKKLHFSNVFKTVTSSFILLILFANLFLLTACEDEITQPTPKPPGYQEDIPWPSLADSPWPRYHGNSQNNGRTTFYGPISGSLYKDVKIPLITSGIVVGADSNIYFATSYPGYLYSLDKDGNENWRLRLTNDEIHATPVVANDGTIYIGLFQEKKLLAINLDGSIKWSLNTGGIVQIGISVGLDGTIYFIDLDRNLNAVDKNSNILWKLFNSDFGSVGVRNSAMSRDGKVIYIITQSKLYAIDVTSQTISWTFSQTVQNEPLVDTKGNIYCVAKDTSQPDMPIYYFSLNPNGTLRWKYKLGEWTSYSGQDAAMDKNGNIYFASDSVYSLDYDGNLRWKKAFSQEYFPSPFICDGHGRIYTVSTTSNEYKNTIYCFDSNGNIIWSLPYYIQGLIYWSTTIGYDNSLYVPIDSDSSRVLIIR